MKLQNRLPAEFFGTFWLVCGSAVLAAKLIAAEGATPINLGIGLAGVSLAFGLTVLTMAYAIGHVSGCHLNPARSTGPALFAGAWALGQVWLFWVAPILGAALAGVVYPLVAGEPGGESA